MTQAEADAKLSEFEERLNMNAMSPGQALALAFLLGARFMVEKTNGYAEHTREGA